MMIILLKITKFTIRISLFPPLYSAISGIVWASGRNEVFFLYSIRERPRRNRADQLHKKKDIVVNKTHAYSVERGNLSMEGFLYYEL